MNWEIVQSDILEVTDYKERAFLIELGKLIAEQKERIELSEQELDGRMWSPKDW